MTEYRGHIIDVVGRRVFDGVVTVADGRIGSIRECEIPAFFCLSMMAFTSSISDGIMLGLIAHVVICIAKFQWKELNAGMCVLALLFVLRYIFL